MLNRSARAASENEDETADRLLDTLL
jgi:hypothetical protein